MPKFITEILAIFKTPSADDIAQRQLEEAERQLLDHRDRAEYHDAMTVYLETKIARLSGADQISAMTTNIVDSVFERTYARKAA